MLGFHFFDGMSLSGNGNLLGSLSFLDKGLLLFGRSSHLDGNFSFMGSNLSGNCNLDSLHYLLFGDGDLLQSLFVDNYFLGSVVSAVRLGRFSSFVDNRFLDCLLLEGDSLLGSGMFRLKSGG